MSLGQLADLRIFGMLGHVLGHVQAALVMLGHELEVEQVGLGALGVGELLHLRLARHSRHLYEGAAHVHRRAGAAIGTKVVARAAAPEPAAERPASEAP